MCRLSNKELYDFMLETFRDRVPDESHVSLITEMFKVMYDTDQEDALTAILASMDENALPTIKEFLNNHSYLNKEKPIEGLTENFYNYLISHCKRNVEKIKIPVLGNLFITSIESFWSYQNVQDIILQKENRQYIELICVYPISSYISIFY